MQSGLLAFSFFQAPLVLKGRNGDQEQKNIPFFTLCLFKAYFK